MEKLAKAFQQHLCHGNHRFLGYMTRQNIQQITRVVFLNATISNGTLREQLLDKVWLQEALCHKLEILNICNHIAREDELCN